MHKIYPFHSKLQNHLWIAFGLIFWVFLFLYFSEPFDINKFSEKEKIFLLPIYGLIQGVCYSIPLVYQSIIYRKRKQWLFINELAFLILLVGIGAFINFLFYNVVIVNNDPETYSFFQYFKWIYLPAVTIILPFVIISRIILGKLYNKKNVSNKITIKGKGKNDFITLKFESLLFIQSSDNYIEVNFIQNNVVHKKLMRGTISEVQKSFPELLKTHRSFLINKLHFIQFKTENKKLFLDLGFGNVIPVSRNLQMAIKNKLQPTTNK
ncbi:LytTR family transcriptional regulator DNA-binding domain-containing protein [uncultured Lacinutrix sp.]|uniref:LytTR family transcriptional regulator DNA-binding domain-containing protein n=1 Tax=uncultured Lacinutrix sp. TaxID=574032 RepID=UPI002638C1CF|nr:LytTR family transcriptional regulator DNA-binding domain-containing protein [uncultured Lacinutrix sp.]